MNCLVQLDKCIFITQMPMALYLINLYYYIISRFFTFSYIQVLQDHGNYKIKIRNILLFSCFSSFLSYFK